MKKWVAGIIALALFAGAASAGYRAYLISELRKPVLGMLNDPDSAQFRNESVTGWTLGDGLLCGEVNAKNRMGGYVGYRPFSAIAGQFATLGDGELMDDIVRVNCPAAKK